MWLPALRRAQGRPELSRGPALAGRPSRALELRLKAAITFSCVATSLAAQAPTPAALEKLSQARTISAADCTAARVGDAVPTSAVGEPAGAVTIAAPRWVAATETLPARCEVDGSIDPVDRSATARPIRFRVWLPADWNGRLLYVPEGFAQGYQTLRDDTEVAYRMGTRYVPEAARGLRWDDPRFAIRWPVRPAVISERDATYPDVDPELADA